MPVQEVATEEAKVVDTRTYEQKMADYNTMCAKFDNAADRFGDAVDRKAKEIALVLTDDTKKIETDDERCRRAFEEAQFSTEQSDRLLNEPKSWEQVQFDSCFT